MSPNPYTYTNPITSLDLFYGRHQLLDFLVNILSNTNQPGVAIYGGRRSGKTSILRILEFVLNENYSKTVGVNVIPLFIDLQLTTPSSPRAFFQLILNQLEMWWLNRNEEELNLNPVIEVDPAISFAESLKDFYKKANSKFSIVKIALLIDEADKIQEKIWSLNLDDNLRALVSNVPGVTGNLGLVMAGGSKFYNSMALDKDGSPLRNVIEEKVLFPCAKADILRLINEPTNLGLPKAITNEIAKLVGGNLFLTQYIMKNIWDIGLEKARMKDVNIIFENFLNTRRDFGGWLNTIGLDGRQVYDIITKNKKPVAFDQLRNQSKLGSVDLLNALNILIMHSVIDKFGNNTFVISGEMFNKWYVQNTSYITQNDTYIATSPDVHDFMPAGQKPVKILFLAANPLDTTRLQLDKEIRAIDKALVQAGFGNAFEIRQYWAVQLGDLQNYLLRHKPQIVHFSGHGSSSNELILEDEFGNGQTVSVQSISRLFSLFKENIRCVILNACFSASQADAIADNIDCVIGVPNEIEDNAAVSFSRSFYQALGYGKDVRAAFDLGIVQMDMENHEKQNMPIIIAKKVNPKELVFFVPT